MTRIYISDRGDDKNDGLTKETKKKPRTGGSGASRVPLGGNL